MTAALKLLVELLFGHFNIKRYAFVFVFFFLNLFIWCLFSVVFLYIISLTSLRFYFDNILV